MKHLIKTALYVYICIYICIYVCIYICIYLYISSVALFFVSFYFILFYSIYAIQIISTIYAALFPVRLALSVVSLLTLFYIFLYYCMEVFFFIHVGGLTRCRLAIFVVSVSIYSHLILFCFILFNCMFFLFFKSRRPYSQFDSLSLSSAAPLHDGW